MRTVLNVLWLILAGLWMALGYVLAGVVMCITIIGIPFGVASFKMAGAALVPFGKEVALTKDLERIPEGAIAVGQGGELPAAS